MEGITIPADMIAEQSAAGTVVSIRDVLVLLGASDEALRGHDERQEILAREPWRRDGLRFVEIGRGPNGWVWGITEGEIDWSGTRFAKQEGTGNG